jgi:hypothetical protein
MYGGLWEIAQGGNAPGQLKGVRGMGDPNAHPTHKGWVVGRSVGWGGIPERNDDADDCGGF